jgi:hypothetical protein
VQVGVGAAQAFPHIPQLRLSVMRFDSQPSAAFMLQLPKLGLHADVQVPVAAVHAAVEFAGIGHTVHAAPQAVASVSAEHLVPQRWLPAGQVVPHAPAAEHVAAPPVGTGQTVHAAPQAVGSVGPTHLPAHAWFGAVHWIPHVSATHVATPPAGTGQGAHAAPQNAGSVCATHLSVHALKPTLHVKLQVAALHAAVPLVGTGHAPLHVPQWVADVWGSAHSAPQRSGAEGVQPVEHWKFGPVGAQRGAAAPHFALQAPQLVAFERSVSQPSVAVALQSA